MVWGDPINWVGQVATAARDGAAQSPAIAERAAAFYGLRLLRDAYNASKRGESDAQGRENVSAVLGELNWAVISRCQAEAASFGNGTAGAGAAASSDQARGQICMRFLLGGCKAGADCRFHHGCPFCPVSGEGTRRCFETHIRQQGFELSQRGKGGGRGQAPWQAMKRERSRSRRRGEDDAPPPRGGGAAPGRR